MKIKIKKASQGTSVLIDALKHLLSGNAYNIYEDNLLNWNDMPICNVFADADTIYVCTYSAKDGGRMKDTDGPIYEIKITDATSGKARALKRDHELKKRLSF